ncbi:MAG: LysM peptidoglycan-binding domain-containing protein [Desulfobacterales bacterium]|nr:FecR family protein [Deltaproteobacteria bacterium]NNL42354.1 LysM peptidoglycan-binding domain-containing protein [Desulfobacterales bacterium]
MKTIDYRPAIIRFIAYFLLISYGLVNPADCIGKKIITIKVKENQGIRDISRRYLDDPNRWEDVLRANNLKSPDEIKPRMILRIPVGEVFQAKHELEISGKIIQQATMAGAKIFTPKIIAKAIQLRNSALLKQKSGNLHESFNLASSAAIEGKKALKVCISKQDVPAQAVVHDRRGYVHSRKPSDNLWKDVYRNDILHEGEKIRTLSESSCDILFRNDSRLRLKENSQALIQKMRANLLEDKGEAKVSLVKGDVFALLSSGQKNERFQLDIPGVKTKVDSKYFWVGRDKHGTRFANYDGKLEISSAGSKVVLKKNQGSVILHNKKPTSPRKLLASPRLLNPESGVAEYNVNIPLTWESVSGADHYLLEISHSGSFSSITYSREVQVPKALFPDNLADGSLPNLFYWRVTAVSSDKLRGQSSEARFIKITQDDKPPFLVLQSPDEGLLISNNMVDILGMTETDSLLTIQDQPVDIAANGKFRFRQKLVEGTNSIIVKAIDRAGNITKLKRSVTFLAEHKIDLTFDRFSGQGLHQTMPGHFVVSQPSISLAGKTNPDCSITVTSPGTAAPARATAGSNGLFQINLKMTAPKQMFNVKIVSPSGVERHASINIEIDDKAPVIHFDEKIPSAIRKKSLSMKGKVEDAQRFYLNKSPVSLQDGQFSTTIELKPGLNRLSFAASDWVGNLVRIEKEVVFDPAPPKLLKYKIVLGKGEDETQASVIVKAKDSTGLIKTAPFMVQIGKQSHTGHMILSGSGNYMGHFSIPEGGGHIVKFKSVTLSDYLGNSKEYRF